MTTKKYSCGPIFPSGCTIYTGTLPTFLPTDSVSCDANIDEIFEKYGLKIDEILSGLDLTDLDKNCLTFDPETITIKGLHQIEIDKLCNHETRITDVETGLSALDIGAKLLTIDLGCMTSDAAPCQQAPNVYSLLSILLSFKSKICELDAAVAALS